MTMSDSTREVARHHLGLPSAVRDGRLNNSEVSRQQGGTYHQGNRVNVIDGMIFQNGDYVGHTRELNR